jgi:hypothetical protein
MVGDGRNLFLVACGRDLKGVVAKWAAGTCQTDGREHVMAEDQESAFPQMAERRELSDRSESPGRSSFGVAAGATSFVHPFSIIAAFYWSGP